MTELTPSTREQIENEAAQDAFEYAHLFDKFSEERRIGGSYYELGYLKASTKYASQLEEKEKEIERLETTKVNCDWYLGEYKTKHELLLGLLIPFRSIVVHLIEKFNVLK